MTKQADGLTKNSTNSYLGRGYKRITLRDITANQTAG
jgi:hypothetical protein